MILVFKPLMILYELHVFFYDGFDVYMYDIYTLFFYIFNIFNDSEPIKFSSTKLEMFHLSFYIKHFQENHLVYTKLKPLGY